VIQAVRWPKEAIMSLFRRSNDIEISISPEFDREYEPGQAPVYSGIYRCRGCGCESVAQAAKPFLVEDHPQHLPTQGPVRWRLAVAAQQEPH
jgi:hypothetical protein